MELVATSGLALADVVAVYLIWRDPAVQGFLAKGVLSALWLAAGVGALIAGTAQGVAWDDMALGGAGVVLASCLFTGGRPAVMLSSGPPQSTAVSGDRARRWLGIAGVTIWAVVWAYLVLRSAR